MRVDRSIIKSSPVNWAHPLNRGLVSWWLSIPDWSFGSTFQDLCGRNHGTLTNMDPATDWVGGGRPGGFGALDFDITNDYVSLGQSPITVAAMPLTVSWWEKVTSTSAGVFPSRFRFRIPVASATDLGIVRSNHASFDALTVGGQTGVSALGVRFTGAPSLTSAVGAWLHWAVVGLNHASNATGDWVAYVNGVSYSASATAANFSYGSIGVNRIGHDNVDSPANCLMDDVRIFNRAISAAEVMALYLDSRTGYQQTLNRVGGFPALNVAGGGGFQAAWASGSNVLLRAG